VLSAPVVVLDEVLKMISRGNFSTSPVGRMMRWGGKCFGRYASFGTLRGTVFPPSPSHGTKQSREH
jgi:hypothetical protein